MIKVDDIDQNSTLDAISKDFFAIIKNVQSNQKVFICYADVYMYHLGN